jgi:ribose transport system permease protein
LIDELVAEGLAVVLISSDLVEVIGMSDRILVMSRGRIAGELQKTRILRSEYYAPCTARPGTGRKGNPLSKTQSQLERSEKSAGARSAFDFSVIKAFLARYNIALIFVALVIIASFVSDDLLTRRNITNVLRQSAGVGISAMGMLMVILTGGIDLSVGSVSACGSVLGAKFLSTMPVWGAVAAAILIGCAMGSVSGYLVAGRGMPPFVVTLGMMTIARGTAFIVSKGQPIPVGANGQLLNDFGKGLTFGVANPVILMLVIFGITWFLLHYTAFGRLVTAIGSNQEAVHLSGISIGWYIFSVYVISGGLSALAGIVNTSRAGVGSPV